LISSGKEIKFRPFTVKEEKLFLMASQSNELKTMIDTTKQVVNNCIISDINIDDMPTFDFEYLFLNIRARSISEIIDLNYKCNNNIKNENDEDTHKCNNNVKMNVNILEVKPKSNKKPESKIQITDNVGLVMKYPTFETFKQYDADSNETDVMMNMILDCIECIYDKEQMYYAKDTPKEELSEFIENLQTKDLAKIKQFFDDLPKLSKDLDFKCNKCGYEEKIVLEGLDNFFV
jgi:hypothetical protein